MEHPVREIPNVIHALTEGSPAQQQHAILTYFTPTASFLHPFCRVSSFSDTHIPFLGEINSRWAIWMIYRWYKILSPKIVLEIHSVVFDQKQQTLYVSISQVFSLWFVPFYAANVSLVTVLGLSHNSDEGKHYIESQQDLYQLNELIKFVLPGGDVVFSVWQWFATLLCILGSLLLAPMTWAEQKFAERKKIVSAKVQ